MNNRVTVVDFGIANRQFLATDQEIVGELPIDGKRCVMSCTGERCGSRSHSRVGVEIGPEFFG